MSPTTATLPPAFHTTSLAMNLPPSSPRPSKSRKAGSMHLGGRFHPVNFASSKPSSPVTPSATAQRQYSEAQRHLHNYQREMIAATASRSAKMSSAVAYSSPRPDSPRLAPLGSPGPVTPLELEQTADYLSAGIAYEQKYKRNSGERVQQDLVDMFAQDEARRQRDSYGQSSRPSTAVRSSTRR